MGLFNLFSKKEKPMPVINKYDSTQKIIDRKSIPAEQIDAMQRIKASDAYCRKLYKTCYKGYPEMPFISQDRELNTNWIEQTKMFGITPTKEAMTRYSDGLLPGHVYMLYWINKSNRKRIPVYFEYKYGIEFNTEKEFLEHNGYLSENKLTEKGLLALEKHHIVIDNHAPQKANNSSDAIKKQILSQKASLIKNGFEYYQYVAATNSCAVCQALDGKAFLLSNLTSGVNAPPMHQNCRCSVAAYMDNEIYNEWLDTYKNHGLDFDTWKKNK